MICEVKRNEQLLTKSPSHPPQSPPCALAASEQDLVRTAQFHRVHLSACKARQGWSKVAVSSRATCKCLRLATSSFPRAPCIVLAAFLSLMPLYLTVLTLGQ